LRKQPSEITYSSKVNASLLKKSVNTAVKPAGHVKAKSRNMNYATQDRKTVCEIRKSSKDLKKSVVVPSKNKFNYLTSMDNRENRGSVTKKSFSNLKPGIIELAKNKNRSRQNCNMGKKSHVLSMVQRYDTFAQ